MKKSLFWVFLLLWFRALDGDSQREVEMWKIEEARRRADIILTRASESASEEDPTLVRALSYKKEADSLYALSTKRLKGGEEEKEVMDGMERAWRFYALSSHLAIKVLRERAKTDSLLKKTNDKKGKEG